MENMGPSAPQEDVARLKASSGTKTILAIISGAMEQVSFWSGKIEEYLATAPAMRRERKTVQEHHLLLDGLDGSMKDLDGLMKVGGDIARLKACLIPATMANLCAKLCKALKKSYMLVREQLSGKVEEGQKMSAVLQEASTNFPFDTEIQGMLLECGTLLQKAGESKVVIEVMEALQNYKAFVPQETEGDKQAAAWQKKAEELRGRLASFSLSPSAWKADKLHALAKQVMKQNLEQCLAEVSVAPKNGSLLFEIVALLGELAYKVGEEAMTDVSSCLELLEKVTQAYSKVDQVRQHGQLGDEQQVLTNVAALQRACSTTWEALKKAVMMPAELRAKIHVACEVAESVALEVGGSLSQESGQFLRTCLEELESMAMGGPSGEYWLDGAEMIDLESMTKWGEKSLFKVVNGPLVEKKTNLSQALSNMTCSNM